MFQLVNDVYAQTAESSALAPWFDTEVLWTLGALLVFIVLTLLWRTIRKPRQYADTKAADSRVSSTLSPLPGPSLAAERAEPSEIQEILLDDAASWLQRLRGGLSKTRQQLKDNLLRFIGGGQVFNDQTLEQVHEVLYRSDMGAETADHLVGVLRRRFLGQAEAPTWPLIASALQEAVVESMHNQGIELPLTPPADGPWVILVVGVNGVGKTTSIGKLAARFIAEGKSVLLGAGDTYRAAAIEQLQVWGDRLGVPVIKHQQGSDPASVAFDAVKAAKSRGVDVLLIDTAGRLHNKQELMDELAKVKRVIARELPGAPHEIWLVIDATTGQNAVQQVKAFQELVQLTGLVVTKLDGTAKGGVIVGIKRRFQIPIRYIGVGEKAADLKEFSYREYAESLFV